jgi:hypothetical protein
MDIQGPGKQARGDTPGVGCVAAAARFGKTTEIESEQRLCQPSRLRVRVTGRFTGSYA